MEDLQKLLHKSLLDSQVPVSKIDSDELVRMVVHALMTGLAKDYPLFERIAIEEINESDLEEKSAQKLKDGVADLRASFYVKHRFNIDKMPGTYDKRVFIGGAYDDLPTLRLIENYVKANGYIPMLAFDFDIPISMDVHSFDILLLHNCKFAIFELSLAAGQYNEVEWAINLLRKETVGLCKSREGESKEKALQKISSMIKALFERGGYPIITYSDFNELKSIIKSILKEWEEKNR